jgi:sec-independent protein translocase protein TatC
VAFPYVFFEIWRFVSPGLHDNERKSSRGVIFITSLLFLLGVGFGYFVISPFSVQFLATYTVSDSVVNRIDLSSFISTVTSVTLASGLVFELPIIVYFLAKFGILTSDTMRQYRRHAIVVILVLSSIITPPDVTSQILVTLPVLLLYEISIKIAKRIEKKRDKELARI